MDSHACQCGKCIFISSYLEYGALVSSCKSKKDLTALAYFEDRASERHNCLEIWQPFPWNPFFATVGQRLVLSSSLPPFLSIAPFRCGHSQASSSIRPCPPHPLSHSSLRHAFFDCISKSVVFLWASSLPALTTASFYTSSNI